MNDEKVRAKLDILANGEKEIEKKLDEFIEDQEKIDDKQNKDLVKLILIAIKKHVITMKAV
jgi:hypothetical protein